MVFQKKRKEGRITLTPPLLLSIVLFQSFLLFIRRLTDSIRAHTQQTLSFPMAPVFWRDKWGQGRIECGLHILTNNEIKAVLHETHCHQALTLTYRSPFQSPCYPFHTIFHLLLSCLTLPFPDPDCRHLNLDFRGSGCG